MWLLLIIMIYLWLGTGIMRNCIDIFKYLIDIENKKDNKKHKLEE